MIHTGQMMQAEVFIATICVDNFCCSMADLIDGVVSAAASVEAAAAGVFDDNNSR
jgi:hypothetical protein